MEVDFKKHLLEAFSTYSNQDITKTTIESFLDYLLTHNLIEPITIKRYTLLKEFELEYPKHDNRKTQTVLTLSNKYQIAERSVWTVLKDHHRRFWVRRE